MRVQRSGFRLQSCDRRRTKDEGRRIELVLRTWHFVLISVAAGCGPAVNAQPKAGEGPAAALEVVLAGQPARKTLTLVTTQPARVEAIEQTRIYSKLAAYVSEVLVDYGDSVKLGQPLLKLAAPELDAELAQKQALLDQARAELLQAEAGARAAEAAVATTRSKIATVEAGSTRASADIERWRSEYSRIEQLAARGSVNRQLVDETQQKLRAAEASQEEARAAIEAAKAGLEQSQAEAARSMSDIEAAKARVRVAEANVHQVEATRSYVTLKSPLAGVVTLRQVDPGHFVLPAAGDSAPLLIVARTDKLRVFAAVPEIEAAYVDLGDPVTIEVPSLRGAQFPGKITRTNFALDAASRSLLAIIDLDNADSRLRPGLFATARITLQENKHALTLPSAAVVHQGKEAFCYRLIDGKATKTPIQLGIKVGDDFEVTGGVADRETVILNKALLLSDGQAVDVLTPAAK